MPEFSQPGVPLWDAVHAGYRAQRRTSLTTAPQRQLRMILSAWVPRGSHVLELGCGSSTWLPYLADSRDCRIAGVDFSSPGIDAVQLRLERDQLPLGEFFVQDLSEFTAASLAAGRTWDVTCSFGLVEHFDDLAQVLRWHWDLLAVGGTAMITVPTLTGFQKKWVDMVNPGIWTWHKPVQPTELTRLWQAWGGRVGVVQGFGGIRLFGQPVANGPLWQRSLRKVINGLGEAADRIHLRGAPRALCPQQAFVLLK
ncbi:MAG: SAM-dependent methyltransferase [Mycobacteriales bacterium]